MIQLQFQVHYFTHPGQQLMILGSLPELGSSNVEDSKYMHLQDAQSGLWTFELSLENSIDFSYRYFVKDDNFAAFIEEWGPDRNFIFENRKETDFLLFDRWRSPADPEYALHSAAFQNAILKPEQFFKTPKAKPAGKQNSVVLQFMPSVVRVKPGHQLAVAGSAKSLGSWDDKKAFSLGNMEFPLWNGEVRIDASEFPVYYKYLIKDENAKPAFWEKTENHVIHLPKGKVPDQIVIRDEKFEFPQYPWKGAGVAIPVFALRKRNGFGVGVFTDIQLLVDWAVETGLKLIQILPVNDTVAKHTWQDSYPYAAISVYALHPIYINIQEIGNLKSEINQQIIEEQGKFLNKKDKIDYEAVMALKSRFFKLIYDQQKNDFFNNEDYKEFFKENEHWLRPYAAFSYLRDLFNTPDFSRWMNYSKPTAELLAVLTDPKSAHYDEIAVHYFIQYHAYRQLIEAANYARSKGVVLKGDIPIGIYRNSVDAWLNPELFHLDKQAGAPPDDFSAKGQNWRFPTYNWDQMEKDNYAWWQQRLRQLSGYFDAFRIDHILGFFRIWEIPATQAEGLMGYFNPSIPYYRDELQNRGIWLEWHRMCKPYIREHFLYERFAYLTDYVKQNYLEEYSPGCYNILPEYDTQIKIEEKLVFGPDAGSEERNRIEQIANGLKSLVTEVLFLEAPGTDGNAFFPRNSLHFTRSYQELDENTKRAIDEVYIDYFYKRNEDFWRSKAMAKLPVIKKATNMLLCGEDLGMVPACVPEVMNELGILSLEVQRMPKNPKKTFGHPADYPYLSVATPSSHDTSTIRGWWEEDANRTQKFYNEILGNHGPAPKECTPDIVRQIIVQHLYSPSMWAIFPIQDLLGMDEDLRLDNPHAERINNPGNPNHYWRYRLHVNLEDLISSKDFNDNLKQIIHSAGRLDIY